MGHYNLEVAMIDYDLLGVSGFMKNWAGSGAKNRTEREKQEWPF